MIMYDHTESFLPHRPGKYFFCFSPDYLILRIRNIFIFDENQSKIFLNKV